MYNEYLKFGLELLDETKKYILESIEKGFKVEEKDDKEFKEVEKEDENFIKNYVTEVDRNVEKILRDRISKKYPHHGIIGEEYDVVNKDADFVWYLDPIDGTSEFVKQNGEYGTILSLYYRGKPVVGIIDHPSLNIRTWASINGGTYQNGKRIFINNVKNTSEISKETFIIGPRFMFTRHNAEGDYDKIINSHKKFDMAKSCLAHTRLIRGDLGAAIDYHLRIWDISPVKLLVEEAKGKYVERQNVKVDGETMYSIIIGKPKVVDWVLDIID